MKFCKGLGASSAQSDDPTVRLLLFSDLHLDTRFQWAGARVARARRRRLRDALGRVVTLSQELRVDAVLCGGDLYEQSRFTPDTVSFVQRAFERLHPIRVLVAPGNHDCFYFGNYDPIRRDEWQAACNESGSVLRKDQFVRM